MTTPMVFNTGDVIKASVKAFPLLFHYGIVTLEYDEIFVHHNTPTQKNVSGGNVIKEPLANFLKSRTVSKVIPTGHSCNFINETSQSLAKRRFNLLSFNCEHFIFIFFCTPPRSPQLFLWSLAAVVSYWAFKK